MLYPLIFQPIFKERVWGGRNLEKLYQKTLPDGVPIGESWEITDRPEGVSVIANGPLAGKDLRWLMENHAGEVLGKARAHGGRFPLLIKILDARDKLSLQVHPPAALAPRLGGEPKTEMWHITQAAPGAELYVGLKRGVTRPDFERKIRDGSVAECFHRVPVQTGDTMFLPSGRVHAIGAGLVIFEIQQNSDTTYRVFDWNRVGLDGKPRELHVEQSLASIDFADFEPSLIRSIYSRNPALSVRYLVDDPLFRVNGCKVKRGQRFYLSSPAVQLIGLLSGRLRISANQQEVDLKPGGFVMLPACLERVALTAEEKVEYLHVEVPPAANEALPLKISIIVPAFNEEKLLPATLGSIKTAATALAARGWQTELIVCDNNSTDRTAELARAAGATVVFEPVNQIARARNTGARAATGGWLVFVDADSHPSPELFADAAAEIQSDRCLAGGATVKLEGEYRMAAGGVRVWNFISRSMHYVAGSFIFCEAAAFREIGGFSQELFASEELDLSRRLKKLARRRGRRIVILHRHPLLTSARKMHLYTPWEHLRFLARTVLLGGRPLRHRDACPTWYDGRR